MYWQNRSFLKKIHMVPWKQCLHFCSIWVPKKYMYNTNKSYVNMNIWIINCLQFYCITRLNNLILDKGKSVCDYLVIKDENINFE